jgi:hypothetical protein
VKWANNLPTRATCATDLRKGKKPRRLEARLTGGLRWHTFH